MTWQGFARLLDCFPRWETETIKEYKMPEELLEYIEDNVIEIDMEDIV